MPILLPCPTLGIKCSNGTLEGSWKPQPGCEERQIEREQVSVWSALAYPLRFIWTILAHFLSMSPGPGPYCPCSSLCLESSLPTCFSWLTSILSSKDVALPILACPKLYDICSVIDFIQTTLSPFKALISICTTAWLFKAHLCHGLKTSLRQGDASFALQCLPIASQVLTS